MYFVFLRYILEEKHILKMNGVWKLLIFKTGLQKKVDFLDLIS